jgi:ribosomal protein L11 methyltransferase
MDYIEIIIPSNPDFNDILVAELGEIGFDTFEEDNQHLKAYIQEDIFDENQLKAITERYATVTDTNFVLNKIPKTNWNAEWEKNFSPVEVDNTVYIRATFHEQKPDFKYEIVINPKMSFGTGHHDTTFQMVQQQLQINHIGKRILDMGAGTGILAILAEKLGANDILAIDIDDWSVENGIENIGLNNTKNIVFKKGDISTLSNENKFDIILANINLNVLKADIAEYAKYLQPDGILVTSGFYNEDVEELKKVAEISGLKLKDVYLKNNWASVSFTF